MANRRNLFRKIMAGAFFAELLAATHPPRKNLALPQEKLRAFSLPHDSRAQLMFGAARFGEPALSASRSLGFHTAPRRRRSPQRLAHRISASISAGFRHDQTSRRAMRPKRLQRRVFPQATAR